MAAGPLVAPIEFHIVDTQMVDAVPNFVVYHVQVRVGDIQWLVQKRYSQFDYLRAQVTGLGAQRC